jgi:YfiH family protein
MIHRLESFTEFPWLVQGVSTRHGGVSAPPFDTLNIGLHVGDVPDAVLENRRRFCGALGVTLDSLVTGAQVLGSAVAWATDADRGKGARSTETSLSDTDALITDSAGVSLLAFSADCPLIAILDPERRAIGLAHASRKGTFGRIAARTVTAMQKVLGSRPEAMHAAIAPCIGPCCYKVGREILDDAPPGFSRHFRQRDGTLFLDLWEANSQQLVEAGLARNHVQPPSACTCCSADCFFSYRASGGRTGRFGLLLGIRA